MKVLHVRFQVNFNCQFHAFLENKPLSIESQEDDCLRRHVNSFLFSTRAFDRQKRRQSAKRQAIALLGSRLAPLHSFFLQAKPKL